MFWSYQNGVCAPYGSLKQMAAVEPGRPLICLATVARAPPSRGDSLRVAPCAPFQALGCLLQELAHGRRPAAASALTARPAAIERAPTK